MPAASLIILTLLVGFISLSRYVPYMGIVLCNVNNTRTTSRITNLNYFASVSILTDLSLVL